MAIRVYEYSENVPTQFKWGLGSRVSGAEGSTGQDFSESDWDSFEAIVQADAQRSQSPTVRQLDAPTN
ncbi:hypothetical protein FB464_3680 [Subtercola boreus]|nr:hypothetical protein FB464_3680 [Subtercola boreus]